ncbi:MAG TPA: hypothetical protein PLH57_10250 [Oligoflexia bacterium]|nr:hypothetical protein [Oligoflexia bacterium]
MYRNFILVVSILVLGACSPKKSAESPENSLREYVSRTFAIDNVEDKNRLIELTTGKVKAAITTMSDADFQRHFIDESKDFIGMKIKDERALSDGRFSITYELSFKNKTVNTEAKILTKKHAIFEKIDERWLISEVQSLKTVIEHQNEMSF